MKELAKILNLAASAQYLGSYYKIAKELGIAPATIYRARDKGELADRHCVRVAAVLGIDPIIVMAAKYADSARDPEVKNAWRDFLESGVKG